MKYPPAEYPDMEGICLSAVLPHLSTLNIAVSGSNSLEHVEALREQLPQHWQTRWGWWFSLPAAMT